MPDTPDHSHSSNYRIALVSLFIGLALLAIKFIAYFLTGSAAIFSDALESIANVAAGSFALYSVYLAGQPADAEHPYGHGKIEFLSAGFEGGMVLAAALVMVVKAIDSLLFHPVRIDRIDLGAAFMGLAMLVTGVMGLVLLRWGKANHSLTLVADGKHLLIDALTSVVALIALGIVYWTRWPDADPIMAMLIAVYVGWVGWGMLIASAEGLMDKQDAEDEATLKRVLDAHVGPHGREPKICSYHKLRHRHSGRYHWVDFHIMVPAALDVRAGHDIASALEYEIEQALEEGNATAHIEPCADRECVWCGQIAR